MSEAASWAHLLDRAVAVSRNAYAPFSKFAVGAVVETETGSLYAAANMENASYGLTVCAEVGALQAAASAGELGLVTRIAVVGGPMGAMGGGEIVTPCGRCRQLIAEAAHLAGRAIPVACASADGQRFEVRTNEELLPHAFGPNALER